MHPAHRPLPTGLLLQYEITPNREPEWAIRSRAFVIVSEPAFSSVALRLGGQMDVLADHLHRARARGAVFAHSTFHAPWGLEITDHGPLSFHAILDGDAWLLPPNGTGLEPARLAAGDVAFVRSPYAHRLVDDPATPTRPITMADDWRVPGDPHRYRNPGTGYQTVLLCGAFRFEGDICAPLLEALPPIVSLHTGDGNAEADATASLRATIAILAAEFCRAAPGQQTVLDRLLDLLLVFALRTWFSRPGAAAPSWYRALDDPEVGRVLQLIHAEPDRPWTVDSLAVQVGLSRAALARRFSALVDEPPLTYLTRWRMTIAAELLRESVSAIAHEVGYRNEFAFATAFRRVLGDAPTRYRAQQQDTIPLSS